MTLIAATPGTTLIDRHGDTVALIVGYQLITGSMVFPVFVCARPGIAKDEAICDGYTGSVSHPASQKWFETVENWTAFAEDEEWHAAAVDAAPVEQPSPGVRVERASTHAPEPSAADRAAATRAALAAEKERIANADPNAPLVFGTKTFTTTSFWHWAGANAVFQIEGNNALPNDKRVVKIKRDEMAALKRAGASLIDPHVGVVQEQEQVEAGEGDDEDMDVV